MDGEEKITDFITELECLTPHCAINNAPSDYFTSCVENTLLTVANKDLGVEIFTKSPKIQLMSKLWAEEILAKQQINFDEYKTSSPEQRYLNLLQNRPGLIQRVSPQQLASYLGIKPQSLSRLRARILEKSTKSYLLA